MCGCWNCNGSILEQIQVPRFEFGDAVYLRPRGAKFESWGLNQKEYRRNYWRGKIIPLAYGISAGICSAFGLLFFRTFVDDNC